MTFRPDSNTSHLHHDWTDKTVPLWLRTQRRLQRMETWSAQHRTIESGSCERIQLLDERVALACRHLVLLVKDIEEKQERLRSRKVKKPISTDSP